MGDYKAFISPTSLIIPPVMWNHSYWDNIRTFSSLQEDCQNYIRVIINKTEDGLFICGTNAFKPACRVYKNFPVGLWAITYICDYEMRLTCCTDQTGIRGPSAGRMWGRVRNVGLGWEGQLMLLKKDIKPNISYARFWPILDFSYK